MLVLSRALSAPRVLCSPAATAAGVTRLRVSQVAALLLVHARGPQRATELGALLGRPTGQPVVAAFRRLGLMTLTGRGQDSRLSLTPLGAGVAQTFTTVLDKHWGRSTNRLPKPRVNGVLEALGAVSGRGAETSPASGYPVDLIVMADQIVAQTVDSILKFADHPGLREATLRPLLLLLTNGPSTPAALGYELGVGAPAVNVALAPTHRTGLVEWHQTSLRLTAEGERVVRRIRLASDAFWLDVERTGGTRCRSDAQVLLTNLGTGHPANARP